MVGTEWEIIRRRVAIAGRITDPNNTPQVGVLVTLTSPSKDFKHRVESAASGFKKRIGASYNQNDQKLSKWDGIFYFTDLPDGQYTVSIHPVGQGTDAEQKVSVARDKQNNLAVSQADFTIP